MFLLVIKKLCFKEKNITEKIDSKNVILSKKLRQLCYSKKTNSELFYYLKYYSST